MASSMSNRGTLRAGRSAVSVTGAVPVHSVRPPAVAASCLQPVGTPGPVYAHHHDHRVISSDVWSLVSLGDRCRECPPSRPSPDADRRGWSSTSPAGVSHHRLLACAAKPTPRRSTRE